jgi:hypothetical protein
MTKSQTNNIAWPPTWLMDGLFSRITERAIANADEYPPRVWWALRYLKDCVPDETDPASRRGATYKMLAFIAHRADMDAQERREWYGIAEELGLTQRHAGHIIARAPDIRVPTFSETYMSVPIPSSGGIDI